MTVITHSTQRASISIARVYFISCVCLSLCLQNGALIPPAHRGPPPPPPGLPPYISILFGLEWQIPVGGDF